MTVRGKSGGGSREKVRVRSRKRSQSSRQWLERQLNDPYVARAKREGMRSRAAYKLMEIDDKARFLKKGARVVDLGAAPGGWSQVAAKRVGAPEAGARGCNRCFANGAGAGRRFRAARFSRSRRARASSKTMLGGPADVVLSDMAANATGHARPITSRSWHWWKRRRNLPARCLRPAAPFWPRCCKAAPKAALLAALKRDFQSVKHVKPAASRAGFGGALSAGDGISWDRKHQGLTGALVRSFRWRRQSVRHFRSGFW